MRKPFYLWASIRTSLVIGYLFLSSLHCVAQSACLSGQVIAPQSQGGLPVPSAPILVCTSAATGVPCSPLATGLYYDSALSSPIVTNPFSADANGNWQFCAATAPSTLTSYIVQATVSNNPPLIYPYYLSLPITTNFDPTQPGPIGATTPSTGNFTQLYATTGGVTIGAAPINSVTINVSSPSAAYNQTLQNATGTIALTSQLNTSSLTDWTNSGIANGYIPVWDSGTSMWTASAPTVTFNPAIPGPIGGTTPSTGAFTTLNSTSGALNGTLGATTPHTGAFTTITGTTAALTTSVSVNSHIILPSTLLGFHGSSATYVQMSDGTGTPGDLAVYATDGSVTDGGPVSSGVDDYFTLSGCTVASGNSGGGVGNYCNGTATFIVAGGNTTPSFPAMADTTYIANCTANVGATTFNSAFPVNVTHLTTSTFTYTIGATRALVSSASSIVLMCHLHHN